MWWMKSCFLPRKCRPPHCTLCFFHWKPWYDITMEIGQHLWSKIHHSVEIHTTSWKLDLHWGMNHCLGICMPIQSCDPMDYSPPGSSAHGILQARILEWVATSYSRGSQSMDLICASCVSCIGRWMLYHHWTSIFATLHVKPFIFEENILLDIDIIPSAQQHITNYSYHWSLSVHPIENDAN